MSELARQQPATISSITDGGWTRDQIDLVKRTIVHGVGEATDDELALFEYVCRATGLNPFLGQIWAIRRKEQVDNAWQERMTIQTGIAGYRLIAERTGRYEGRLGPYWCGPDGEWRDVWLDTKPPAACKIGILKHGFREPLWAVATFAEFAQRTRGGELTRFWRAMPANQLAKCAMALACREAFPQETSNLYADAELPEVEEESAAGIVTPTPTPAVAPPISMPTHDQVEQLRSIQDATVLLQHASPQFQQTFRNLVIGVADPATADSLWRQFWKSATLAVLKDHLHDAITEMSTAEAPDPPISASAVDPTSPPAQVSKGKADQAGGDQSHEGVGDGT